MNSELQTILKNCYRDGAGKGFTGIGIDIANAMGATSRAWTRLKTHLEQHGDSKTTEEVLSFAINRRQPAKLSKCLEILGKNRFDKAYVTHLLKITRMVPKGPVPFYMQLSLLEFDTYDTEIWTPNPSEEKYSLSSLARYLLAQMDLDGLHRLEQIKRTDSGNLVLFGIRDNYRDKEAKEPTLRYDISDAIPSIMWDAGLHSKGSSKSSKIPGLIRFSLERGATTNVDVAIGAIESDFPYIDELFTLMADHGRKGDLEGRDKKGRTPLEIANAFRNTAASTALSRIFAEELKVSV